MNWLEIMKERHSVRKYTNQEIPPEVRMKLIQEVKNLNLKSGLHMQVFFDEPDCFRSGLAHYGSFEGVRNYIALVGRRTDAFEERAGYYGERLVLFMQNLGLNSCWVALTHGHTKAVLNHGEKLAAVIAFGYGASAGASHRSKEMADLCSIKGEMPDWFKAGMEGAMLAPTAMNQQKFLISWDGKKLSAQVSGRGFYTKLDLGIVKSDFELASGHIFEA